MNYTIDYADASNRQEIISNYSLYFHIANQYDYDFDIGHLIISLLIYMVEEGRLNAYSLKSSEIREFVCVYLGETEYHKEYNLDDITSKLIDNLQGTKPNGDAIKFKIFNSKSSIKIAYINYDVRNEGFKITDKGLEFLISSKEIPQEAKLSVSLYLFKLQIEKQKYRGALNTIKNINLETLRQLDIKNEILSMNRHNQTQASRLYEKYWGDYFALREEEENHYKDATERFKLYKTPEYIEKISLTPEEIEILNLIDLELAHSSKLQSIYTKEIATMPEKIHDIDISLMQNMFLNLFNFKEHFDRLEAENSPIEAFMYSLSSLFMPKQNKRFSLATSFARHKILKPKNVIEEENISLAPQLYEDLEQKVSDRMLNNYRKLFSTLMKYLETINAEITDISDFIQYVYAEHGDTANNSIDLLSFLLSLNYLTDRENKPNYGSENTQTINLDANKIIDMKKIEISNTQDILTYFWFENMKRDKNINILVSTEPNKIVYVDTIGKRSIGNIKIKLEVLNES